MDSKSDGKPERMPNGKPVATDRLFTLLAVTIGVGATLALSFVGDRTGRPVLPVIFLLIFVPSTVIGFWGNRLRRPISLMFSPEGVVVEYRGGRTRLLSWENIAAVRLSRFLSDVHVDIRYIDGREEDRAHVYGEAALELKRRFDARRGATTS